MYTEKHNSKEIVLAFINALNKEDFKSARPYLNDDFKFKGVMGSRDGADVYMADMEKMKFKYKLHKTLGDNEDVGILYEFTQGGITLTGSAWYHLQNGKISSLDVIFDPRPLLGYGA